VQGTLPPPAIEAGDIAVAAQMFSHDIRNLPQISSLTVPQLVRFNGVTSIVKTENHQLADVDTTPYTILLRDRLLLGDREKLRFIERQLPPLNAPKKHGKNAAMPIDSGGPDYEVLAELHGEAGAGSLRVQLQFVDFGSRQVLLNETYSIAPEASGSQGGDFTPPPQKEQPSNIEDTSPMPAHASQPSAGPGSPVPPVPSVYDDGTAHGGGAYTGTAVQ
jgi:hypothetical protein